MMRFLPFWVLAAALLLPVCAAAQVVQQAGGLYTDTLAVQAVQPYQLRPFVLPGSERVVLDGQPLSRAAYRLDPRHGHLWLLVPVPRPESRLVVSYQTLPFQFQEVYRLRALAEAESTDSAYAEVVVQDERPAGTQRDLFEGVNLRRSGSITRGILAGNNRDVTVESGLRLQLDGEIVEGVNLQAVLTDENTPILPEGTTQRLDEFDKVFIQLQARQGTARLGDFDLSFQEGVFGRFSRKLQGVSVEGQLPAIPTAGFAGGRVTVAGATARGIFRAQQLTPIDGVQGPYRLEGANGERFIIVIPGSEIVYLDGQRLLRGETNDYTIDYATGELTFTPRRIITADRRINVEFQYTTNQFTRTLTGASVDLNFWPRAGKQPGAHLGATFLREADSRQFEEEFGFTAQDSLRVVEAGDGAATRSGAEIVVYDPEAPYVQYVREPRFLPDGSQDTVFVALDRAPLPGVPVFRVRFSRVGTGKGRYVRVGRSVNGILYEYRGPGLGEYEPVRFLPKPKQQRLFDLRGHLSPFPGLTLFGEWAQSLNDLNRLSPLDAEDDVDHAFTGGIRVDSLALGRGGEPLGFFTAQFQRRYTGGHFASFDRIRPVEFTRLWNLGGREVDVTGGVLGGEDEVIDEGLLRFAFARATRSEVSWGRMQLGETFEGTRRVWSLVSREPRWPALDYQVELIDSRDALAEEKGRWLRQQGKLSKGLVGERLIPQLEVEHERRIQNVLGTDSLAAGSAAFIEIRPGVSWQRGPLTVGAEVEHRAEQRWLDGRLRDAATAWTVASRFRYRPGKNFNTEGSLGYRRQRFEEPFRIQQNEEGSESVLLRLNTEARPMKRAFRITGYYEAQTERTPTLQEIYVRTGPELGQFVWEDSNGDGAIQIDEFIPERVPDEGTYVRTFVPSDSLSSVIAVQARFRLEAEPGRLLSNPGSPWLRFLSNISSRTVFEVLEKSRSPHLTQIYLLNLRRFRDPEHTLNGRLRLMQELSLFRPASVFGLDLSVDQVRGLTELAAGEESRFLSRWRVEGRYRPGTRWRLRLGLARERNRVFSEAFASRRYDIHRFTVEPELTFQPQTAVRFSAAVGYTSNDDRQGGRQAKVVRFPLEMRYSRVRRLQVTARLEAAYVDLRGAATGLAQFELTEGRGPGTSFLWNLSSQYVFNRYLRASLSYDGRAPADAPVLHTVRMQLSAVF